MKTTRIVLFFSQGVSLHMWHQIGILAREAQIYLDLQKWGFRFCFVTYGGAADLDLARTLPGIDVVCNRWRLPARLYARWLHRLHGRVLKKADIYKTNQISGSDIARRAAQIWKKPLYVRSGYLLSDFMARQYGAESDRARDALALERRVCSSAARIVVTTDEMRDVIQSRIPTVPVHIVPNYVQTDIFRPIPVQKIYDLIFVGRLAEQKNLFALLEAVRHTGKSILMVGAGPLESSLKEHFGDGAGQISWTGTLPNQELPQILNSAQAFILPSLYEGHPKTLLEAMACGLPVIGADVDGINSIIAHEENGYLCGVTVESIMPAIQAILSNTTLQKKIGQNARQYILDTCSLEKVILLERELYTGILKEEAAYGT